jgi:Ca2+:H+ antiporter
VVLLLPNPEASLAAARGIDLLSDARDSLFITLLAFVPAAIGAVFLDASPVVVFFLSAAAIVPLARFIGESTEELASRTNPVVGGVLNATFGNAAELIIGVFALKAGLIEVVKASITGSIIGNLLFVLGLAMFWGGISRERQSFNKTGILAQSSTLFLATIALIVPAIFFQTAGGSGPPAVAGLSILVSLVLVCMYGASLFFSLHTHKHLYLEEVGKFEPRWSTARAVATLLIATLAVAGMSDLLVKSIEPLAATLGWSQLFIGVIFVAIVGNAAEHFSAVLVARKDRMDLALQIAIGSATQIVLVVAPVLVILGAPLGQPMNLIFDTFELVAMVLAVFIVNFVVQDGESNWLEGLQLLAAYAIMAIAFYLHP